MKNEIGKFKFIYKANGAEVIVTLSGESSLEEMLTWFEGFLRASTYSFDGHIEIAEDEK